MTRLKDPLPILLLLSGFAGISYEVLYGRILGNLLGDQFAVSAAVLITFLGGSGLGARFAHRMHNVLWAVEGGIGGVAALVALSYDSIDSALYGGLFRFYGLPGQLGLGVALFAVPAFLVGASVPIFAAYFEAQKHEAGTFSRVYAIYNFGAALTAVLLEFVVIRLTGIRGALILFAAVNLIISAWLFARFGRKPPQTPLASTSLTAAPPPIRGRRLLALLIASVASAVFQLYMVKMAEFLFGPFRETFALVLAVVLLGIAVGSRLVPFVGLTFPHLMGACVLSTAILLTGMDPLTAFYALLYPAVGATHAGALLLKWITLLLLMLLPAVGFGATIPALIAGSRDAGRQSGRLLFWSATANAGGFLLMVFLLHPYLEYGTQLFCVGAAAAAAWLLESTVNPRRSVIFAAAILALAALRVVFWDESLLYVSYDRFKSTSVLEQARTELKIVDQYRDRHDVFSITNIGGAPYFFINGYISFPLNSPSEKIVGLLGVQFSPRTDDALVLGLGSGSTASVVGLAFERTDAIEINRAVRANIGRMKQWNFDIEHNPRVNMIVDDAIHYVRTSQKKYSLILNTVTSPLYFSSSKLYTLEFLRWAKARLHPDGIYVTWIDSRAGDLGIQIMLRTLQESFSYCSIFYIKSGYFLLLCGSAPITLQQTGLGSRLPQVYSTLARSGLLAERVPLQIIGTAAEFIDPRASVESNRLDFPALEFEMAGLPTSGFSEFKRYAASRMSIETTGPPLRRMGFVTPEDFAVHARRRLGKSPFTIRWLEVAKQKGTGWEERVKAGEQRYEEDLQRYARHGRPDRN